MSPIKPDRPLAAGIVRWAQGIGALLAKLALANLPSGSRFRKIDADSHERRVWAIVHSRLRPTPIVIKGWIRKRIPGSTDWQGEDIDDERRHVERGDIRQVTAKGAMIPMRVVCQRGEVSGGGAELASSLALAAIARRGSFRITASSPRRR